MKQVLTMTTVLLLSLTVATAKDYKLTVNVLGPKGVKVENVKVALYFGNTALLPDTIIGNKALFSNYLYTGIYNIEGAETDLTRHLFLKAKYQYNMQHNRLAASTEEENILNVYFGIRFLKEKRAELSITAYDLLNSFNNRMVYTEQNFTRTRQQANYGRFLSLNFSYTFRKYKTRNSWSGGDIDW